MLLSLNCLAVNAQTGIDVDTVNLDSGGRNEFAPSDIKVNKLTNLIYVSNLDDDNVSVIDGETNRIVTTVDVGDSPSFIAINEVTNRVYVASDNLYVIDGESNNVIANVGGDDFIANLISINEVTNRIYVVNSSSSSEVNVTVIDGNSNVVIDTVHIGEGFIVNLSINEVTNKMYVVTDFDVRIIDLMLNRRVDTITVGSALGQGNVGLYDSAINEVTNRVYVTAINIVNFNFINCLCFVC